MDILLYKTRLTIIACRHMVPNYYSGVPIKIPEIAEVYGFKPRSINPSFSTLTKAGILHSQVGGRFEDRGFSFSKDPKEITLYDIAHALEGDAPVASCGDLLNCNSLKCKDCSIYNELQKVMDHHKMILSTTTIYGHYENMNKKLKI